MQNQHTNSSPYLPGTCNIGLKEIKQRKSITIIMVMITVSLIVWLIIKHIEPSYRLLIFFPLAGTLISFFQVYFSFCVAFGVFGMFSFNGKLSNRSEVNKEYLSKDRIKAFKIIGGSAVLAAILTIALYYLPL